MNTNVNHLEPVEGSEDIWLSIPQHILVSEDWREGDVLTMTANAAGVLIANRSKCEREGAQPGGGGSGEGVGHDDQNGPPIQLSSTDVREASVTVGNEPNGVSDGSQGRRQIMDNLRVDIGLVDLLDLSSRPTNPPLISSSRQ